MFNLTISHLLYIPSQMMWGNHSINYWRHLNHNLYRMRQILETLISLKCKLTWMTHNLLAEVITHCHEALWLGKKWNKQTPWCKGNPQQPFQLVSTYHCSAQGRWWKTPSYWLYGFEQGHTLNGTKYFSTLNLCAGYHHISLDQDFIPKAAFISPFGKYECLKIPFG